MSYYDYRWGQKISAEDYPFYALIQAAMRKADSTNIGKLRMVFPEVYDELRRRYEAPGGVLEEDSGDLKKKVFAGEFQSWP